MSDGAKPLTVAPQSIVKPRNGEPTFSYRSRSFEDARVRRVLVGVHLEREGHTVLLGDRREGLHRVGLDRDLHARDREAELRGRLDLQRHVLDQLVLGEQAIAVDADIGVHGERRGHEPDLVDEVAEPAREASRRSRGNPRKLEKPMISRPGP